MNLATTMMILAMLLPVLILFMAWSLQLRTNSDREKSSPFECGFDPVSNARMPFSTRFFLLAIIFIVFDIEIVLLMPVPLMMLKHLTSYMLITYMTFIIILILGLIHEWNEGSLDWST